MKKTILTFAATVFAAVSFVLSGETEASAQDIAASSYADLIPGAFMSRPANAADGKILTMDETILSHELNPRMPRYDWTLTGKKYVPTEAAPKSRAPQDPEAPAGPGAFTQGNGLYFRDADGNVTPIAEDADPDIVYGQFVSRNEFGIEGGIFWAPDSTKIAFYRKDESRVTSFPLLNIKSRTGELTAIKYPMAGMDSEVLRLCVYDIESRDTLHLNVTEFGADRYLTNITWSPDSKNIFVQVLDRSQKHCVLNMYDAATGDCVRTLLTEEGDKYVEPLDPLYFLKGSNSQFIYRTASRDGYRNLYLCDTAGSISRLTAVDADVQYAGNDGRYVYYTSAEVSPIENHLFRVDTSNGKTRQLTEAEGWHIVEFSPDYKYFTDYYSSLCNPGKVELRSTYGKLVEVLSECEDPTLDWAYGEIVMGTVKSADGAYDNYYRLMLPLNFDPSKKYPLIVYVYGGPHSQMVTDRFLGYLRRWEMYMAQRGYIVYVQDNRGTENRGLAFEQAIHRQCGQEEMADQMMGVNMLLGLPFVDSQRVGVHGWSYGGFMTISLITNYPDVFKVAVAGGPVIDWKWYEVMYGERYMETPQSNPDGFEKASLINKAGNLKGKLLICQGAVDNVVVWQNSLSFVQECINHNVQVDYFPYPTAQHNMVGRERVHLHDKISEYFELYL